MRLLTTCLLTLLLLLTSACESDKPVDQHAQVRIRANALLQTLRDEQWLAAADYVLINQKTKERIEMFMCEDKSKAKQCMADFFKTLYSNRKPGDIFNISHPNYDQQELVLITYRHGDIDGFFMRKDNDQWWYVFN